MAGASGAVAFKRQGQPHCPHTRLVDVVRPGHFSVHTPARHCCTGLLLAALAQGQRQHPGFPRPQHQPPGRSDVEARRIAPDLKDQRRQPGAARRLVCGPHGALQIGWLDHGQAGRIEPVLGKAGGEKPAAIAAGGRITDPDNSMASATVTMHGATRKPERKPRRRADVTRQRGPHLMQPTAGEPAFEMAVNRNGAQGQ